MCAIISVTVDNSTTLTVSRSFHEAFHGGESAANRARNIELHRSTNAVWMVRHLNIDLHHVC
jgi:hypothetical protein